jgi:hypothetical protein
VRSGAIAWAGWTRGWDEEVEGDDGFFQERKERYPATYWKESRT